MRWRSAVAVGGVGKGSNASPLGIFNDDDDEAKDLADALTYEELMFSEQLPNQCLTDAGDDDDDDGWESLHWQHAFCQTGRALVSQPLLFVFSAAPRQPMQLINRGQPRTGQALSGSP